MKATIKLLIIIVICLLAIWVTSLFSIQGLPMISGELNTLSNLVGSSAPSAIEKITVNDKYDVVDIYNGVITNEFFLNQQTALGSEVISTSEPEIKNIILSIINKLIKDNSYDYKKWNISDLNSAQLVDFGQYIVAKYSISNTDVTGLRNVCNYAFLIEDNITTDHFHTFIYWTRINYLDAADTCIRFPIKEIYFYEVKR